MQYRITLICALLLFFFACQKKDFNGFQLNENPSGFTEISSTVIGAEGAAEISAFDPLTKKLFVITNTADVTRIDILDLTNPAAPVPAGFIDISPYGGGVNSVDVSHGKLVAAVEGFSKTDNGKVVIFNTSDNSFVRQVSVGALPDMLTYSPDGDYILTANEGEPGDDYVIDPVGSVSIINVKNDYSVVTTDFSSFAGQFEKLKAKGLRIFGPNASFAQDIEPEYIAVSPNSRTAWVTLQENNAVAKIDIPTASVIDILPLGFKNYSQTDQIIDPSDKNGYQPAPWPVSGMYQPDAIAVIEDRGIPFLFTANEGDVREWGPFKEDVRVKEISLDPTAFPSSGNFKDDANLGRLSISSVMGDPDSDGDYDELYSFGARSFSIWNGNSGNLMYDSRNELEKRANDIGKYADSRSDDKGVEPEGIIIGKVGKTNVAFVGLERVDLVILFDVSNPVKPKFIKTLITGDAPEGLLLIPAADSPSRKSLLVVSSEDDGTVKIYEVQ